MSDDYDDRGERRVITWHATHRMNTIDRAFYEAQEWEQPPAHHRFKCMFCGAIDSTAEASSPCPWERD